MKNKNVLNQILILLIFICFFSACNTFNEPNPIWVGSPNVPADPVIASMDPPDSAVAGIQGREISIIGSNFSTTPNSNYVYFQNQPAMVKSSSQNQIVVYRPTIYGDTLSVSVQIPLARGTANLNKTYKIERPVYPYPSYLMPAAAATLTFYSMEVDKDENLYIGSKQVIYQIPPAADTVMTFKSLSREFLKFTDMKFGVDGYLYFLISKTNVYRTTAGSSPPETFVTLDYATEKLDFDQNQNIYTGFKNGIYVIKSDRTVTASGLFAANFTIKDIRVYNGELYVNAAYTGTDTTIAKAAVWKNSILDVNGTLSTPSQVVVDLSNYADPNISTCDINSFNIDKNGTIYLCLKKTGVTLSHYLYIVENDGSIVPFYQDEILPDRLDQLVWGNYEDAYLNRGVSVLGAVERVLRMKMGIEGAPYLGRE